MQKLQNKLSKISLVSNDAKTKIMQFWSKGRQQQICYSSVLDMISLQSEKNGAKVALVRGQNHLTYKKLELKVNSAANFLKQNGVIHEQIIALRMQRSFDQIIWILAILKSGGCYLPIDPNYPQERQQYILEDSRANLLITDTFHSFNTSCIFTNSKEISLELSKISSANPDITIASNQLAYIIYTSGSTGKPKGVMIDHKGLVNLTLAQVELFEINESSVILQFASMSFDAAISEWSTALASGATLCLMSHSTKDVAGIIKDIYAYTQTTVVTFPPSLALALPLDALPNLQTLVVAGEACSKQVVEKWKSRVKLINAYGPTECTVCATAFCYDQNPLPEGYPAKTIGKPILNTEIYILDSNLKLLPAGIAGEIYIGGVGLARGYLNRKELTEDKFISLSLADNTETRLYKTGDLARWLEDGNIEYIGREDFQVKIRGYRIELGEIENVISSISAVRSAIVIADEELNPGLQAYVEVGDDFPLDSYGLIRDEIESVCRNILPEYMVPVSFMILSEFPLNNNGKIDRKALIAKTQEINSKGTFVVPETQTEKLLAQIWSELFYDREICVNDDFFRIGGDSIIAIQLLLLCQKHGLDLDIQKIFSHPILRDLAAAIDSDQYNSKRLAIVIPVRRDNDNIPLSFAQQRMWFLNEILEDKTIYNILLPLELLGELDSKMLGDALQKVVERHEVLRTRILYNGQEPIQYIEPSLKLEITEVILDARPISQLKEQVIKEAQASMKEPFNLAQPPLLRVKLFRLSERHHVLLLTMHHIISDAWSIDVLFNDISSFYNAYIEGTNPILPELKIQYADFAIWHREWLQGENLMKQLSYWQEQLIGAPSKLDLTTDYIRKKQPTYQGANLFYKLNDQLIPKIEEIIASENITLFMFLMSVLQILLSHYSREKDIVVGFPIANRHYLGTENLLGFFVNTLPLRANLNDNLTFKECLKSIYLSTSEAYSNQDVPFELLVEKLELKREVGYNSLFQVVFGLQNVGNNDLKLAKLEVAHMPIDMQIARFDLTVSAIKSGDGITMGFEYSTDLFVRSTIERFARHFEQLIINILNNPNIQIDKLNFITDSEKKQIIEWSRGNLDFQLDNSQLFLKLFEDQANQNGHTIAMISGAEEISYEDLNEQANRRRHYLKSLGIERSQIIALKLDRGIEQIVWILAILKAGGCYLPIDPDYPQERQKYILEDSKAEILITNYADKIGNVTNIDITKISNQLMEFSSDNLGLDIAPHDAAYVIYTSGSTGKPKGVIIEHGSLANLAKAQATLFEIGKNSHVLQFASVSFDAAVWEWVSALSHGATLISIENNQDLINASKQDKANLEKVTIATIPPSLAQILPEEVLPALKTLVVAGEACTEQVIEKWHNKVRLINAYGPTECTVCATAYCYEPGLDVKPETAKVIGKPILGSEVYILDSNLQIVPAGVKGEIYIGGVCLARGYLNRKELTEERFIVAEIEGIGGVRLYKTGDIAKWVEEGNIEYIGREDFQVKIRGYRIELGEIESILSRDVAIKMARVLAEGEAEESIKLVAYLVLKENEQDASATTTTEIKDRVKEELPAYMLPSKWVIVDEIPLTINGKVDKEKLKAKAEEQESANEANRSLSIQSTSLSKTEAILQSVLCQILNLDYVDVKKNFFALGGDSISSIRYAIEAKKYGIEFSISQLFDNPTINQLAEVIDSSNKNYQEYPPILLQTGNSPVPLSFAQQRLWFVCQLLEDSYIYNIPLAIDLYGELDHNALSFAFKKLIERHEILRTQIKEFENGVEQVVVPIEQISNIELIDLSISTLTRYEIKSILLDYIKKPFDFESNQLMKIISFKVNENHNILLVIMHHLITDGWSMAIFCRELSYYYNIYCNNQHDKNQLPEVLQYKDFAIWQREWLQGERLMLQLKYWQYQLKDIPEVINLPTDKKRTSSRNYKGRNHRIAITSNHLEQIQTFIKQYDVSLFMFLLTVFQLTLHRYSNDKEIVVGCPIANRHYPGIENTIGFFANTTVININFEQVNNFDTLLRLVRRTVLNAYQYQDLPFEKLVEALKVERSLSWNPVFQVMFSLNNVETNQFDFSALKSDIIDLDIGIAKFDLSLTAWEEDNCLNLNFEYAEDLFVEETIAKMAQHYISLIEQVIQSPEQDISLLTFMSEEELYKLVFDANKNTSKFIINKTAVELFEEQVDQNPYNIAIIYVDEKLNFKELNAKANQLANQIIIENQNDKAIIPIIMSRSPDMLIAILAVLKAGCAYLPLEVNSPIERLREIINDTGAKLIICDDSSINKITVINTKFISYNRYKENITNSSESNLRTQILLSDLAYVIYTSGSTGRPKGVTIEHKSLTNYLLWCAETYPCQEQVATVLHSSYAYDMSITSLLLPIITGRAVHILEENQANQELPLLFNSSFEYKYDFIKLTPSHLSMLKHLPTESLRNRTHSLIIGGEQLNQEHIKLWQQYSPETILYNEYGPTESTVACSAYKITMDCTHNPVPIGKSISNCQMYILDQSLQPVPNGVVGELYIGGIGVSKGYINSNDHIDQKFIQNPFSHDSLTKLYRTGDLAHFLNDGNIQLIGRIDNQVKIRGYRIELGDIEVNIESYEQVVACVVVKLDNDGQEQLAAYIVPKSKVENISYMEDNEINELNVHLSKRLPEHMLPNHYIIIPELPLNTNGKVDKTKLPDINLLISRGSKKFILPRNEVEAELVSLWQKLLNYEPISVDDNFFTMGGHSMLMTQVIMHVASKFGTTLSLRAFFEEPTIENLANIILNQNISFIKSKIHTELENDIILKEDISLNIPVASGNNVLLTGATGFLGAHLLFELASKIMQSQNGRIYYIVRAGDVGEAYEKLLKVGQVYQLNLGQFSKFICPIIGDVSKPMLGLSEYDYLTLSQDVDIIFHNAALINHVVDYSTLMAANVSSTKEIIKLASVGKLKHINYISTLSNYLVDADNKITEDFPEYKQQDSLAAGYALTKWVSEILLSQAKNIGMPVTIYRPNYIVGSTNGGATSYINNHLLNLIKGCLELKSAPAWKMELDLGPVDFIAKLIVENALGKEDHLGKVYNISNPNKVKWESIINYLKKIGYEIDLIPEKQWQNILLNKVEQGNALYSLLPVYLYSQTSDDTQNQTIVNTENTLNLLSTYNLKWPLIDNSFLNKYFSYLSAQGFL